MPRYSQLDTRPFIRTAIQKGNYYEVSRRNQTTHEMYLVKVDGQIYINWIKSRKDQSKLEGVGLTRDQIAFLTKNQLKGEIRN